MRSNTSGKVEQVTHTNGDKVQYLYDAAGNRVAKLHTQGTTTSTTRYVRDASGNTMAVYKNDALAEVPIYGSSRLGMYTGANTSNSRTLGNKSYELTNHLGNVMAVVTDDFTITTDSVTNTKEAEVISSTDYYPFGLEQPGTRATSHTAGSSAYRYGFNGKEKDQNGEFGLNHYDYGFRIYNPSIGRFLSVDPLAREYAYYSPYQFTGNSPIKFIDLDGLERAYLDPATGTIIPASDHFRHTPPAGAQFLHDGPTDDGGISFLADLTPASEIKALYSGTDFQGNEVSTGEAMAFLVLNIFPPAKYAAKAGKVVKIGLKNADEIAQVTKTINKAGQKVSVAFKGFGGDIVLDATRRTTILGRYPGAIDGLKKSGAFNVEGLRFLDVPKKYADEAGDNFFELYNKKFLDKAIERGDAIRLVSDPNDLKNIFKNGKDATDGLTTFGKEIDYLKKNGFEIKGSQAIKKQ